MRKVLTTFGEGWFEVTPSKITPAERDALLDLNTSDEDRGRIKSGISARSSRAASSEDAGLAQRTLSLNHSGPLQCATVVLPLGHGFVVTKGGWVRF